MQKLNEVSKECSFTILQWLRNRELFVNLFGEKLVLEAIDKSPFTSIDLTTNAFYENEPKYLGIYEATGKTQQKEKIEKLPFGKERVIYVTMHEYKVCNNYQANECEYIATYCFNALFSWFKGFKWSIHAYQWNSIENAEIYLNTDYADDVWGNRMSLYVPVQALLNRDYPSIAKRNEDYLAQYYYKHLPNRKWNNIEDNPTCGELYKAHIQVLATPEAKQLEELLTTKG